MASIVLSDTSTFLLIFKLGVIHAKFVSELLMDDFSYKSSSLIFHPHFKGNTKLVHKRYDTMGKEIELTA
jgi:hypothetical protein